MIDPSIISQAGQNHVTIENLPNWILEDSIRAEGTGNATIFDVIYRHAPIISKPANPEIITLQDEKAALQSKRDAFEYQSEILKSYAQSLHGDHTRQDTLKEFLGFYAVNQGTIHVEKTETNRKIKELDDRIKELKNAANVGDDSMNRRAQVSLVILAEKEGPAEIMLSYGRHHTILFTLAHLNEPSRTLSRTECFLDSIL